MLDLIFSFSKSVLSPSWIQLFFILIEGVLSSSWIQVSFILIEGVCLGLESSMVYKLPLRGGLQCIPKESYEFVIPKSVIHLGERFVRET